MSAMTDRLPKIEIAHLAKSFGNKTVLRDVSLSIPAGQSYVSSAHLVVASR